MPLILAFDNVFGDRRSEGCAARPALSETHARVYKAEKCGQDVYTKEADVAFFSLTESISTTLCLFMLIL